MEYETPELDLLIQHIQTCGRCANDFCSVAELLFIDFVTTERLYARLLEEIEREG